ncbi:hypothetical protein CLH62_11470 [Marinobacter guineae]|uniref:Uncharacterized protein n=1 Tax=Marinobacter guineae TaxID=432303 RepID=A0A2G1VEM3_9GAMM|nr:hypothetical protein CLH62_11470 [Marinobacter guineae]
MNASDALFRREQANAGDFPDARFIGFSYSPRPVNLKLSFTVIRHFRLSASVVTYGNLWHQD